MNNEKLNNLVGKSFEDLSIEEMEELQGAAGSQVNSSPATPTILYSLASTVASGAVSGQASKAISTLITAAAKCE